MSTEIVNFAYRYMGIESLICSFIDCIILVRKRTRTSIISPEILRILDDPEKSEILDQAVEQYKQTKDWSKTRLHEIL